MTPSKKVTLLPSVLISDSSTNFLIPGPSLFKEMLSSYKSGTLQDSNDSEPSPVHIIKVPMPSLSSTISPENKVSKISKAFGLDKYLHFNKID